MQKFCIVSIPIEARHVPTRASSLIRVAIRKPNKDKRYQASPCIRASAWAKIVNRTERVTITGDPLMLRCKEGIDQKNDFDLFGSHIMWAVSTYLIEPPLWVQFCGFWDSLWWICMQLSFCACHGPMGYSFRQRSRTDWYGIPSARSYRSARMNQNASPPVLWSEAKPSLYVLTPSDPLRPVFRHPLACMIIRVTTPIACLKRLLRWACVPANNRLMAGWDSSSRTTPDKGGLSWWISDSSIRRCLSGSLKNSRTASKGWSGSFTTSENLRPWLSSLNVSRVIVTLVKPVSSSSISSSLDRHFLNLQILQLQILYLYSQ